MSRSKHTEAQIIAALKQVEAGRTVEDMAREQGVSKHTIYAWKAKNGGMDVSEGEEGPGGVGGGLGGGGREGRRFLDDFKSSDLPVCELMGVPRSSCRYRSRR